MCYTVLRSICAPLDFLVCLHICHTYVGQTIQNMLIYKMQFLKNCYFIY